MEHVWYVEGRGNLIIEYTPEGANGEFEGGGGNGREEGREGGRLFVYAYFLVTFIVEVKVIEGVYVTSPVGNFCIFPHTSVYAPPF